MKKFFTAFFISISFLSVMFYTGCGSTSSDNGAAVIKGKILDSLATNGVSYASVTITSTNFSKTVTADTAGNFICLNLEAGTYNLTAKAPGYYTKSVTGLVVPTDDTLTTNVYILFTNIFLYNSIEANEYMDQSTYCAVSLDNGSVLTRLNALKDIELIKTIYSPGDTICSLCLVSTDLDTMLAGYETKFSPVFASKYTKTQFDSLMSYPGFDPGNLNGCYPNKWTEILDQNSSNSVYAFYLCGKSSGLLKRWFGLIHIEIVGTRTLNQSYVRINIKLNKNGENNFNPNQKK